MIDPIIIRIIAMAFALLFLLAAAHKFNNRMQFRGILDAYKILPNSIVILAAICIPVLELSIGIGWLVLAVLFFQLSFIPLISIALLTIYALAIVINLKRGRNYIDCGCGFSAKNSSGNSTGSQQISSGLVLRNIILIALVSLTAIPSNERTLVLIDYIGLILTVVALVLLYGAFNQLLINNGVINSWRQRNA